MSAQPIALRFRGPVLPDGEPRDLYVVDGHVTYEPVAGAELVAEGWIVPGLVDAHCHIGLQSDGAAPRDVQEQQALTDRDAGTLLVRDAGMPKLAAQAIAVAAATPVGFVGNKLWTFRRAGGGRWR